MRARNKLSLIGCLIGAGIVSVNANPTDQPQIELSKTSSSTFNADWEGVSGRTYFFQCSFDLQNWMYAPFMEYGDGAKSYGFSSNSSRAFFRLIYLDDPSVSNLQEAESADFDLDGLNNFYELKLLGTDPLDASEPSGTSFDLDNDGLDDFWEIENFGNLDQTAFGDADGDGVSNLEELNLGTDPTANDQTGGTGGGGGGNTFSGTLPIPTNEENLDHTGNGDENVATSDNQTFNWTDGASSLFVIVGIHSEEHPTYTDPNCTTTDENGNEVPCEFNDIVKYTVTPSIGNAKTGTHDVNDLHQEWLNDGKQFDLGAGSKFYLFKEQFVVENTQRTPVSVDVDVEVTNIGDGALPSGATVAIFPVQIQPKAVSAGTVGNLIMSNKGKPGEKHFVSTKKDASLNTDNIEFEVTGISQQVFDEFLEWEGGQAGATGLERLVSRAGSSKEQLKVKVKKTGDVVDLMNVWTVWTSLNGNVQNPVVTPVNSGGGLKVGEQVSATYQCTGTITPASIITDADRPNLTGANSSPPPGGVNAKGVTLAGGANRKWDMSRRIKRTIVISANPALNVSALDKNIALPGDKKIGNDDAGTGDENNDPYGNGGVIRSGDRPTRGFGLQGGGAGSTYDNDTSFEEFARLEIDGSWYLISDPEPWFVHFKFNKENVSEASWGLDTNGDGDQLDQVNEANIGQDLNGDGDQTDIVTRWKDNNTTSAN